MKHLITLTLAGLFLGGAQAQHPLRTWGDNQYGKLGNGTATATSQPALIGTANWIAIDGGDFFSVGIQSDGSLWTWGDQADGHLGNGQTTGTSSGVQAPAQIGSDKDWEKISAGQGFTLAIRKDGTLWGWGDNLDLGLGSGSSLDLYVPTQIGTANDWASVYAGNSHTLAIKTDGTLWAWGDNNHAKLGDGTTVDKSAPVQVGTATDWKMASAGNNTSFAIKNDGTLWQWGQNTTGSGDLETPRQLGTGTNWALVRSSDGSHFGIKTDGTLWAWGTNMVGQLGLGSSAAFTVAEPTQVGTDVNWQDVAGGYMHTVALKTDHTIWGMGAGDATGLNAPLGEKSPKQIGTGDTWMAIASGRTHMLALGGREGTPSAIGDAESLPVTRVFPNPAGSYILFESDMAVTRVDVLSVTGVRIISGNGNRVDLSGVASGLYLYRIWYAGGMSGTGKFFKK